MKNIEAAFTPTHSRPRFFAGTAASAVLDQLHKGLAHAQPFMLVLGTPGAGKTFDVLEACARWGTRAVTRWVDLRTSSPDAVLDTLLRAFDIDPPTQSGRRPRIEALARVSGETTRKSGHFIVIVDDAHDVPTTVLAELTRIANEVRDARGELRAILAGHDSLESRLADVALQGFAARTGARIRVVGMDVSDVRSYLHHVLAHAGVNAEGVFSRKSAREVHAFADGIPGRVDALATESARIAAQAGVTQVAPEHVRAANAALRLRETAPAHKPAATMAAPVATTEAPPASPTPVAPAIAPQPVTESAATVEPTAPADPSPAVAQDAPIADAQSPVQPTAPTTDETPVVPSPVVPTSPTNAPSAPVGATTPSVQDSKRRMSRKEARRAARSEAQRVTPSTPPASANAASTAASMNTSTTDAPTNTPTPVADPAPVAHATPSERPALPRPEAPPLDSAHPRVKEWVSRFEHAKNDRSGKLPPITTPDALPTFVAHRPASTVMSRRVVTVLRASHSPAEGAPTAPVHDTVAKPSDPATNDTTVMPRPNVSQEPVAPALSTPTTSDANLPATSTPAAPVEPRNATPTSDVVPTNVAPPVVVPTVPGTPAPTPPARSTHDSAGTAPRHERPRTRRQRRAEQRARMAAQSGTVAPASSAPSGSRIAEVVAAAQPEPTPVASAPTPRPNGPRSPRHMEWLQGALPILLLIAIAVGAVMYSLRGGLDQYTLPSGRPAVSTPPVAVAPTPNPVDSALEPARYVVAPWPGATPVPVAGSPATNTPVTTTDEAPVTEVPATTPEPVTTTVAPASARPVVDLPVPAFRLSVGTFLFQDRAQQRAREITRRTGLTARVKATGPESARMWRVYVGEFTTETEAEAEADRLLSRGIVTEALVESIPGNASR